MRTTNLVYRYIKEIATFFILIQVFTILVPSEIYKKYLKVIAGILMIFMIVHEIASVLKKGAIHPFLVSYDETNAVMEKNSLEHINEDIYKTTLHEYENEMSIEIQTRLEQQGFPTDEVEVTMKVENNEVLMERVKVKISQQEHYGASLQKATSEYLLQYFQNELHIEQEKVEIVF